MKYFSTKITRSYPTTIGNFNIIDMTTYYVVNDSFFKKAEVRVDNSETLVETAYKVYRDIDSFWLFLFANKKINPFELLTDNNTTLKENISDLTGVGIQQQGIPNYNDAILTPGSILLPGAGVCGESWNFGSTGNFSLTGGFAVVDSYNTFSKRAAGKQPVGFTFETGTGLTLSALIKGPTGYSLYNFSRTISGTTYDGTLFIGSVTPELTVESEIDYFTSDKVNYVKIKSEYPLIKKGSGLSPYEFETIGSTQGIDINESIENRTNSIQAYLPATILNSAFTRIKQSYKV